MLKEIFRFEVAYRLKRPATYLYLLIPFLLTIYVFCTGSVSASQGQFYNAPAVIARYASLMSFFCMLFISAIMGVPLYRDIEHNITAYYLSYPISKSGYFLGRFFGSFLFILILGLLLVLGAFVGSIIGALPGSNLTDHFGPNRFSYYAIPYFIILLPNLLLPSVLFFGLVAVTRNIKVIYSSGVVLLLAYMTARVYFDFTDNTSFSQIADPFAYNSIRLSTSIYSPVQLNSVILSYTELFLANRLLWFALSILVLVLSYRKFNLENYFNQKSSKPFNTDSTEQLIDSTIPRIESRFGVNYKWSTFRMQSTVELMNIFRDNFFWTIVVGCSLFEGFSFWLGTQSYMVQDLPRTVALLNIFKNDFLNYLFIIIVFYAGETIHRERTTRFSLINDALPPPDVLFYASKLVAILVLSVFLAFSPIIIALFIQLVKGYTDFHFALYLKSYCALFIPKAIQMAALAFTIHVIIRQKFAGHIVGILVWISSVYVIPAVTDLRYNLFLYSSAPFFNFSDMEGFGHMYAALNWFNIYWLFAGAFLSVLAYLFYERGLTFNFYERLAKAKARLNRKVSLIAIVLITCFLFSGGFIYYNISYLNNYKSGDDEILSRVAYERSFKKYEKLGMPEIIKIRLQEDIDPRDQIVRVKGIITLANNTDQPIDSILIDGESLTEYHIKVKGKNLHYSSPLIYKWGSYNWFRTDRDTSKCRVYYLEKALNPGDRIELTLNSKISYLGFQNHLYGTDILYNGTSFSGGLPDIGYDARKELNNNDERRKHQLSIKDPAYATFETSGKKASLLTTDLTISTSGHQLVIAPGNLVKKWHTKDKSYYRFVQTKPGNYLPLAIVSGRYKVLRQKANTDTYKPVDIEIYYHPTHGTNVNLFASALKDGLSQYSKAYGEYPYQQIRLAETSNYGPYMSSFPSLQTYAEYAGWNADLANRGLINNAYFITTRQLAQQWWRFKIHMGSNTNLLIPEGLSTYGALVLYEKKYGNNHLKSILQYQMNNYLIPSAREKRSNLLNSTKRFDYDAKTGFVLFGLKDLIGEDNMNTGLRELISRFSNQNQKNLPHSVDLYQALKKYTPDSLRYYLTDTWERICYYDNRILETAMNRLNNNQYAVSLTISASKFYSDQDGNESPAAQMADYIDVGVFGESNSRMKKGVQEILYLQKIKFKKGAQTINIIVNGKPTSAGIDPYSKLIDRNTKDNIQTIQ